jgi:hypothetical protein
MVVGRDYLDASPTTGRYKEPYSNRLHFSKLAGLIRAGYFDGRRITVDESEIALLEEVA